MFENIQDTFNDLLFGVRRSIRYHNRRRAFFDRLHNINTSIGLIGGSAAVAAILAKIGYTVPLLCAVVIAVSSTIDLVVNSARQARFHHDLARRYFALEKEIISKQVNLTGVEISSWTQKRLDIESEEPPVLHVLNMICHNELCRAMGYNEEYTVRIGPIQRLLCNIIDIGEHKIQAPQAC